MTDKIGKIVRRASKSVKKNLEMWRFTSTLRDKLRRNVTKNGKKVIGSPTSIKYNRKTNESKKLSDFPSNVEKIQDAWIVADGKKLLSKASRSEFKVRQHVQNSV